MSGDDESRQETAYFALAEERRRLLEFIAELEGGKGQERELIEE